MWGQLAIVAIVTWLLYFIWECKKKYRYWSDRGVPYEEPVFLLGSAWKGLLGLERFGEPTCRLYSKFPDAKMAGLYRFTIPNLAVFEPDVITELTVTKYSHFDSHGLTSDPEVNPLEGHLFNLEGAQWRVMRKKLSPTFTSGKLKWMFPQIASCTDTLLRYIGEPEKPIEVKDLMARFTTDVIGSCAFGYEPESIKDGDCKFRKIGRKVFELPIKNLFLFAGRLLFPKVYKTFRIQVTGKEVREFFSTIVRQSFEHRLTTGTKRNDFIQLLLELRQKGSVPYESKEEQDEDEASGVLETQEKYDLTDDVLTAQAFVFFIAGFETTANTLSFTLYQLAKDTKAQMKARDEVRQVKNRYQGQITYEGVKEMSYLEACVSETMRLHPPVEILMRKCTSDCTLGGVPLTKGVQIFVPVRSIHRDPKYWPNPGTFDPTRFLGETPRPGTYLPFGYGPRLCIAQRFAIIEIKLALANLLDSYEVTPSPLLPDEISYVKRGVLLSANHGLYLNFKKLN